jgi:hypothetical protein
MVILAKVGMLCNHVNPIMLNNPNPQENHSGKTVSIIVYHSQAKLKFHNQAMILKRIIVKTI